jgi:methionyl aminopeptidase
MIIIKTKEEIEKIARAGVIVAETHHRLREWIRPGVTTMELDRLVEEFQRGEGAIPAQKGYNGFPYAICASLDFTT